MPLTHGALLKTTLLDYPGEVASIIFTPRCNLRCPYCHNPGLIDFNPEDPTLLPLEEIKKFLKKRSHLIGAVVISGGEPLINNDLGDLIAYIHSLKLKVKIDTNGLYPERLAAIKADYIAMDIKTSPEHYYRLGLQGNKYKLKQSIEFIIRSGIPHEFRTTVLEEICSVHDIEKAAQLLKGANHWYFTPFKAGELLDPAFNNKLPPSQSYMESLVSIAEKAGIPASIR